MWIGSWALLAGCGPGAPASTPGAETPVVRGLALPLSGNPFAASVDVEADEAAEVVVRWSGGGIEGSTRPTWIEGGDTQRVVVLGLPAPADVELTLEAVLDDGTVEQELSIRTPALPDGFPELEVSLDDGSSSTDALVCSASAVNPGPDLRERHVCFDRSGRPRWQLEHPDNRQLRAVDWRQAGGLVAVTVPDEVAGFDAAGQLLYQWFPEDFGKSTRFEHQHFDRHEVLELDEGPWTGMVAVLTLSYESVGAFRYTGEGILVFDPDTGDVLWDWHSLGELGDEQSIDPVRLPLTRDTLGDEPPGDWLHANAIVHGVMDDGSQRFWLSSRSQDWILAIDPDTDEILWRMGYQGDFELVEDLDAEPWVPLADDAWFFHQHAPVWTEREGDRTTFWLLDNGNVRPDADGVPTDEDPYSRLLRLELDEARGAVAPTWVLGSSDPVEPEHFYLQAQGNVAPTEDGVLYLHGADPAEATEVDLGGVPRWSARWVDQPSLYRVTPIDLDRLGGERADGQ